MTFSRPKGSREARGYGKAHQEERARRLALYSPQDPCSRCGRALGHDRSRWHLPHTPDRTGYEPGFWCKPCNLTEAASRGARITNARRQQRQQADAAERYGPSRLRW